MSKKPQERKAIMQFEIVIRGLPLPNKMMVGIQISRQDMDYLMRTGRLIVNALPPEEPPKIEEVLRDPKPLEIAEKCENKD